jgi:hypothetical protein
VDIRVAYGRRWLRDKESVLGRELIHHEVTLFALIKINFPCSQHERAAMRCDRGSAVVALTKQL